PVVFRSTFRLPDLRPERAGRLPRTPEHQKRPANLSVDRWAIRRRPDRCRTQTSDRTRDEMSVRRWPFRVADSSQRPQIARHRKQCGAFREWAGGQELWPDGIKKP